MAVNPGNEEFVEPTADTSGAAPILTLEPPMLPAPVPLEPVSEPALTEPVAPAAAVPPRARPRWIVPTAIAAVGLIVAGMLGYFLYATIQQRDSTRHTLAATQASLTQSQQQLSAAQADAASKKKVADYVTLYVNDNGRVQMDYESVVNCNDYSSCRTAAQQLLEDMQQFQKDRGATNVPDSLANADSATGDSISTAIAGVQELITGMDNNDLNKIKDGGHKVDTAMLSLDKAEVALGSSLGS